MPERGLRERLVGCTCLPKPGRAGAYDMLVTKLSAAEQRVRHEDRMAAIRLRMLIGGELDARRMTPSPANRVRPVMAFGL